MNLNLFKNVKFKIFLTVFLVYLFYIAPGYITANTNRYIDLTKSIVDDATFNIDKYYKNTRDWGAYKGHFYLGASPGLGLAAIPFYAALKPLLKIVPLSFSQNFEFEILNLFFIFFLALLPGVMIALLLYDILKDFDLTRRERLTIVFGASFGTILFYYSTRFMAHAMGAFILFSAFYILFKHRNSTMKRHLFFMTGILLGAAPLVDYLLAVGSALLLIYYFMKFRKNKIIKHLLLLAGIFFMAAIYAYYHYKCFDNPFAMATTYSQMIGPKAISWPRPKIMFELAFGVYRGIFMYMPVTLLSVYGIFVFFKNPEKKFIAEMVLILSFSLAVFLIISGFSAWDGGGDFGPRYFTCFIPFLMIPIAFVYKKIDYKVIFSIATLSIFINWCGVQYGDADNVFTNIGLFILMGLNSNFAEWAYKLANIYFRKFNVITHFSPFTGFAGILFVLYLIWRKNEDNAC